MTSFFKNVGLGIAVMFGLFVVWVVAKSQLPEEKQMPQPVSHTTAARRAHYAVSEIVLVSVPYGRDDNGQEIYSRPVLVTEGNFTFGPHITDPGTGCVKVKVNGLERGRLCAGNSLTLGMTEGGGKKVQIQFHGVNRPMEFFVERPVPV